MNKSPDGVSEQHILQSTNKQVVETIQMNGVTCRKKLTAANLLSEELRHPIM
nr:hypothetical protein GTC16762_18110 [Pigmentibacter ruber]